MRLMPYTKRPESRPKGYLACYVCQMFVHTWWHDYLATPEQYRAK